MTETELQSAAPAKVSVKLDHASGMLTISVPKRVTMPESFVRACHALAGDEGCGIKWTRP